MALILLYLLGVTPGVLLCFVKDVGPLCGLPLVFLTFLTPIPTAVIGGMMWLATAAVALRGCVCWFEPAVQ